MSLSFALFFALYFTSTKCYIFELWSTEQLDDMIMSDAFKKSVPARTPAIIALYETRCKDTLSNTLGFTNANTQNLPNSYTITLAAFDRLKASDIWYQWYPELMDLFIRYNITTTDANNWCPTILFQPADWNKPIITYNPSLDAAVIDWVWSLLALNEVLSFKNTLHKQVALIIKSVDSHSTDIVNQAVLAQIPPLESISLTPTDIGTVLHAGDTIVVVDNDNNVVNRYLLDTVSLSYEIVQTNDKNVMDDAKYAKMMADKVQLRNNRDWSTRRRYLNNVRTPQFLPSFTEKGFKYLAMPAEICEYLTQLHADTFLKGNKKVEGFPIDGTQINTREIPSFMAHIPPAKKRWIGELLQPMLEEWSGVKLQYSTIYGMREYVKGAVLKTHCDRVETHIISAILHSYHEPVDESWPIEVVGWDGKRYHIEDEMCSMTFYESAKLIHGRPHTYNGTSWVNTFLHYRPTDWKGYSFTADNKLITPTHRIDLVDWVYG